VDVAGRGADSPKEEQPFFGALQQGFNDLGYVEGENIRLVHRFPNELSDRFKSMAAELVELRADVLVGVTAAAIYEKAATMPVGPQRREAQRKAGACAQVISH
jgi:putative ABC transport system substrate-binding protein